MSDCLFCKIINGDIPAKIAHTDDQCVAFHDVNPQAPTHVLIVPRKHVPSLNELTPAEAGIVGHLHLVAAKLAKQHGLQQDGYRTLFNTGKLAGQTVFHIHLHLVGGRPLGWPPG
jgi:histidine triad (HIT) family protein